MTKNCEKSQVTKNRQTYDFSQFSQILLNRQLALNFSDYLHDKELRKKLSDLQFFATHEHRLQFLLLRTNLDISDR